MPLRLYNTFSKREEDFKPLKEGLVTMYTCGPTVYGRPHIGNYSSFLMADLLRRWLEVSGLTVKHVKNITDVGHLVADQDEGEDKVQREAEKEKLDPLTIARRYTQMYLDDEKALNMIEPEHRPRASDFVPRMLTMIEVLVKNGSAYETADGVYFSVETFKNYGTLSGNTLDKLDAGARISVDEAKRHPADFALWKKCVGKNAHHVLRWPSPWGDGFPGWHIECSAMSSALLGETIDIHTGGEDNIFPHHECEIAQSESCSGQQFVRLWLHKRRIDLAGDKMSKSLGNVLTIPDITNHDVPGVVGAKFSALDLRFYLLSVHYRTNLKFTWKGMDDAHMNRRTIMEWMERDGTGEFAQGHDSHDLLVSEIKSFIDEFHACMNSDLNTSGALAVVFECMKLVNKSALSLDDELDNALKDFIKLVRQTFGCFDPEPERELPPGVEQLIAARAAARNAKNFAESDRLRDEIKNLGYEVRDADGKQTVKKL